MGPQSTWEATIFPVRGEGWERWEGWEESGGIEKDWKELEQPITQFLE
ncbi:MAG: hypothetical protein F6J93_03305 [Oscillatoria sp. SIO1A7]|nr:hypothetical protein [Oscillatoria sp. SIO1A7]